eukprot:SAG11_NODE_17681_length_511_cov_1.497573_2_plen_90_part_01
MESGCGPSRTVCRAEWSPGRNVCAKHGQAEQLQDDPAAGGSGGGGGGASSWVEIQSYAEVGGPLSLCVAAPSTGSTLAGGADLWQLDQRK